MLTPAAPMPFMANVKQTTLGLFSLNRKQTASKLYGMTGKDIKRYFKICTS
jgi:hypothetical protein